MPRHARGLRERTGAAGGERRPVAGRNRGPGRRPASQNRDVTPRRGLRERTGGRVPAELRALSDSCINIS